MNDAPCFEDLQQAIRARDVRPPLIDRIPRQGKMAPKKRPATAAAAAPLTGAASPHENAPAPPAAAGAAADPSSALASLRREFCSDRVMRLEKASVAAAAEAKQVAAEAAAEIDRRAASFEAKASCAELSLAAA